MKEHCPVCNSTLEVDIEYMQNHYGETDISLLPDDYIIWWCGRCEDVYTKEEIGKIE